MIQTLQRLTIAARQAQVSLCPDALGRSREYIRQIRCELNEIERRIEMRQEAEG